MGVSEKLEKFNNLLGVGWWWLHRIYMGKLTVLGPYQSQEEAYSAVPSTDSDWECIKLPTRNTGSATQKIKAQVYGETGDLNLALKRASHK